MSWYTLKNLCHNVYISTLICMLLVAVPVLMLIPYIPSDWVTRCNEHSISITIAIVGIYIAAVGVRRAASTSEATFIYEADKCYGSHEMLKSLRVLESFKKDHASGNSSGWILKDKYRTDENNPQGRILVDLVEPFAIPSEVNKARRQVKFYFKSIYDLYVHGKISAETLKIILDKNGIRFLFEVVEPLESWLNHDYDYKLFYYLMCLLKSHYKKYSNCDITDHPIKDEELLSVESEVVPVSGPSDECDNTLGGKMSYECSSLNESHQVKIMGISVFTRIINRTEKKTVTRKDGTPAINNRASCQNVRDCSHTERPTNG